MAKITRKHQKVFAEGASNNGQFGSGAAGTKITSSDPDVLQALPAFSNGWLDAVIGTLKFPALEELQTLGYLSTRQIAYMFQEGIPEYSADATYYTNSIVKKAGTYELYGSKVNDNIGNALTDTTKWEFLQNLSASYQQATETAAGIAEIATGAETKAGTDDTRFITPLKLRKFGGITGEGREFWLSTLPEGWIWANGRTIGNASSNATNRANADTEDLFKALWAESAYSYSGATANEALGQLQVFTSAGSPVARGVSADADWAANRQIAVIDMRGRVSAGRDNMGGASPAGRLTGQAGGVSGTTLGGAGGVETVGLSIAQMPSHSHPIVATQRVWTDDAANGSRVLTADRNIKTETVTLNGITATSVGSGQEHNNVQPTKVCNYILKL